MYFILVFKETGNEAPFHFGNKSNALQYAEAWKFYPEVTKLLLVGGGVVMWEWNRE